MEEIPQLLRAKILLNNRMKIPSFLQFHIPTVLSAITALDPEEYMLEESPTIIPMPTDILAIPCPPKHFVNALQNMFIRSDGMRSISCPHMHHAEGKWFPTWIIAYWTQLGYKNGPFWPQKVCTTLRNRSAADFSHLNTKIYMCDQ